MPLELASYTAEEFFSPVIEQGVLDYRTMPDGPEKLEVSRFFVKNFGYVPDAPLEFVKIDGKYVYKTNREQRIPVKIANDVTVVSLDNSVFKIPGAPIVPIENQNDI